MLNPVEKTGGCSGLDIREVTRLKPVAKRGLKVYIQIEVLLHYCLWC